MLETLTVKVRVLVSFGLSRIIEKKVGSPTLRSIYCSPGNIWLVSESIAGLNPSLFFSMNFCSVMWMTWGYIQRSRTAFTREALIGLFSELAGLESRLPLRLRLCVHILCGIIFIVDFSSRCLFCRYLKAAMRFNFLSSSISGWVSLAAFRSSTMSSSEPEACRFGFFTSYFSSSASSSSLLILIHWDSCALTLLTFFVLSVVDDVLLRRAKICGLTNLPRCLTRSVKDPIFYQRTVSKMSAS